MPLSTHQLTIDQLADVNALAERCRLHDGNTIPVYSNLLLHYRNLPCNLLFYHRQQLIGFLSLFFFYEDGCELVLMVDPAWRRQHIATQLISTILPVIHSRGLHDVLCPVPQGLNDSWIPERGFTYHNGEVQMQWKGLRPSLVIDPTFTFLTAVEDVYITALVELDTACFHTDEQEMRSRFSRLLADESYHLCLMKKDDEVVGKAHLHIETQQVLLSDIAILPRYQGQGFGQALVAYCIHWSRTLSPLPLRLDVESNNQNALHIYQKLGFQTTNTYDFWKIPFGLLQAAFTVS